MTVTELRPSIEHWQERVDVAAAFRRHARCAMHVHSVHATVLACLKDKMPPPRDQNAAIFFDRQEVEEHHCGLACEEEGERCAQLFARRSSR